MFGDVGKANLYISPADLTRKDFSKVKAVVAGH